MNIIFVHGWSDKSKNIKRIAEGLEKTGLRGIQPYYFDYRSRDDEVTLADFAEGLHKQLKKHDLLVAHDQPASSANALPRTLHFITHSTGALVVRRWLYQYAAERVADQVASITFLAPANFGSPLAHKGRSFLGRLAKGIRELDEDFGETGKRTLEALELASPEQWELADYDLFGSEGTIYGKDAIRAAVITGASGYGGLQSFVNEDGTDGTIVVAGAGLSCRKYQVNFASGNRYHGWLSEEKSLPLLPTLMLAEPTHSSILDLHKDEELAGHVRRILTSTPANYDTIKQDFDALTEAHNQIETRQGGCRRRFQQLVFRLRDERGDPIPDYFIEFGAWRRNRIDLTGEFPVPQRDRRGRQPRRTRAEKLVSHNIQKHFGSNVHIHSVDSSYRRFLVDPAQIDQDLGRDYVLSLEITVHSGDDDITYDTDSFAGIMVYDPHPEARGDISWFYPDTTTLIEITINRNTNDEIASIHTG